jgi:Glu-tRNA(Gln) amidotransferase subunit E-like FAD-binding protein
MDIDYEKLGLKCGLEIHQQLDSHKLFCECPSILRKDDPELVVRRRLHAVAGESGEVDIAAKYEASKDKEFVYEVHDTTCLVELDESPPHLINQDALKIALHISLLLNCKIVPITQIMRKTVVNGSNTSGFQRTTLIARDGWIETESGKVGIWYVYLEEDAAREMGEDNGNKIYRLDRLGIPLVEIVTAPDVKSAEQCKEVALFIGDILRSCQVKRGIGTIRQDINISIAGHPRAEIKGFQDPKIFVDVVNKEIERQKKDLDEKKNDLALEVRVANPDATTKFLRPLPGSSRMYPETDLPLLRISREIINEAKESLPKLRSERKEEWRKQGLSDEMIKLLGKGDKVEEFEYLTQVLNDPNFIAKLLFIFPREIASHENLQNIDDTLNLDIIESIAQAIQKGKIKQDDAKHVMTEIAKGKKFDDAIKIEKVDSSEVEQEIAKIVKEKPGLSIGGYMGLVMAKFKGKISGKDATEILAKLVK